MRPSINENTVANFGLLDQIAALHWIKENIHSFGGDKNSVTLMGHTTGAACINYLMVSPVASGKFCYCNFVFYTNLTVSLPFSKWTA